MAMSERPPALQKMTNKGELESAVRIEPKYKSIVPRPSKEEYEALKASLMKDGQRDPLIIDDHGAILDGYTRYEILLHLKKELKFEARSFLTNKRKKIL
jgi:hypothetical protein